MISWRFSWFYSNTSFMRFEIFIAVLLRIQVFLDMTLCHWAWGSWHFDKMLCLCLQGSSSPRAFIEYFPMFQRNFWNLLLSNVTSHPRPEFSTHILFHSTSLVYSDGISRMPLFSLLCAWMLSNKWHGWFVSDCTGAWDQIHGNFC